MGVLSQVLAAHLTGGMREAAAQRSMARNQELLTGLMGTAPVEPYAPGGPVGPLAPQPGTGLMADPHDPLNQMRFAAGLMASPELANVGGSIFNQVLSQTGQDRRHQLSQDLARAQFEAAETGRMERHRQDLSQRRELHMESLGSREALALLQRQADEQARLRGGPGSVQAGYTRRYVNDPQWGGYVAIDTPNEGTPEHNKAITKLQSGQNAIRIVDELAGLVGESGREAWGEKGGRMQQLHGQLISMIGQLRGLGVLEAGEYARMEEQLANPGEQGFARKGTILEQLATVRSLFGRDYQNDLRRYRYYTGLGDFLGFDLGDQVGATNAPPGTRELTAQEEAALAPAAPAAAPAAPAAGPARGPLPTAPGMTDMPFYGG